MFFEGSEKKVDITVTAATPSLRSLGRCFWETMVAQAQAEILSSISNDSCDAYLLSESSLFVWDHRLLMLTCGSTTLVHAALHFIDHLGPDAIAFACYQRKNEYLPQQQSSRFVDDLALLRQRLSGKALRIGHLDAHHHYLFYTDKPYQHLGQEQRHGLQMYHIRGAIAGYLCTPGQSLAGVRKALPLTTLLADFCVDDFLFQPLGYSVNGIRGQQFFTLHVTPQASGSYVSFESNLLQGQESAQLLAQLLTLLAPVSWDVLCFSGPSALWQGESPAEVTCPTRCLGQANIALSNQYQLHFSHYQQLQPVQLLPEFL